MNFHRDSNPDEEVGPFAVARFSENLTPRMAGYEPYDQFDGSRDNIDFGKVFSALFRRKWLIMAILIASVGAALAVSLNMTPLYRATATIEVQRQEAQIMKGSDIEPATIADAEHMATQTALLKSRVLAQRTAEQLGLADLERYAEQDADPFDRLQEARERLLDSLSVSTVANSRVIRVSFVSPDAREAANIVNSTTEGFIQVNLERKYNTTAYARTFLEDRIATTKSALEASERNLAEYALANGILELGKDGDFLSSSLDATSLQRLNTSLADAERIRIEAQQDYLEALRSDSNGDELQSELMRDLSIRKADLTAELLKLSKTFKPDYPAVIEVRSKLDAIDQQIVQNRSRFVSALESTYKSALASEEALRERVKSLTGNVQELRSRSIDYDILQREVDTNRSQYEALLQRYKEIAIAGGVGSSQIAIVDSAETPLLPFSPNPVRNILLGIIFGLGLGVSLAFLLEFLDDTISSPEDVQSKLGVPLLGVVPKTKGVKKFERILEDSRSAVAEAFQSMRTTLSFSTQDGTPRSLVVTSSKPGEGKTSSVLALAYAFARTGKRVLIIDADMRKPSFAFRPGASIGLSGLLTGLDALGDHMIEGSIPNIWLLPSGPPPPNPAELLASDRLAELIAAAEEEFDLVLVDSAPVLGFADAPILSATCHATAYVIQSGGVRTRMVQRSIGRLKSANAYLVGAMLTKVNLARDGHGYGYGYDYGYQQAYGRGYAGKRISKAVSKSRRIDLFINDAPDEER